MSETEEQGQVTGDRMRDGDRIELEVRRRLTEYLASGGVAQGRISMEVLYMLPPEFVRIYTRIFDMALKEGTTPGGQQGAKEKGELGKRSIGSGMKGKRVGAGAGGVGKRYKEYWVIKDENALRVKGILDKGLSRLAGEAMFELGAGREGSSTRGGEPGGSVSGLEKKRQCSGEKCRRFLREGWKYCPYCGSVGV